MSVKLNDKFPEVAVASVSVANTTATAISPSLVIPKGKLTPGAQVRLKASGLITTAGSGTGTLKFDIMGGASGSEAAVLTSTTGTLTVSKTSLGWELEAMITFRVITRDVSGTLTSGAFAGMMKYFGNDHASTEILKDVVRCVDTAMDTEVENTFYLRATLSAGAADNFITCEQAAWEMSV